MINYIERGSRNTPWILCMGDCKVIHLCNIIVVTVTNCVPPLHYVPRICVKIIMKAFASGIAHCAIKTGEHRSFTRGRYTSHRTLDAGQVF
jgi:hypothetical protein